ncbi:MAG: nitrous oxide reductase accessory protein NosL [Candidatus Marinimicrobia bacterium]|nr:nitrous oxide reductase accessory protein NosL [Candidatus Neomarinimicrobiota bacterium]
MNRQVYNVILFTSLLGIVGCELTPQPINYGGDDCDYCRMTIVEEHYGTEILTKKGKAFKFDSIECLAAFLIKDQVETDAIHELYFTDFEGAEQLYPLELMVFVQAKKLKSPMGLNISAYRNPETADNVALLYFGERLSWEQVNSYVKRSWF